MTIWSTHAQLSEGGSMLKHLPPLDDLFDFEKDSVDRTVNWVESFPIPIYDMADDDEQDDEVDGEDDGEIDYEAVHHSRYGSRTNTDEWYFSELERQDDEEAEKWMSAELELRRLAAPKNLRPGLVRRAVNRFRSIRAERILNEDRHWRLRVGVFTDAEKLRAAQMRALVCNADFTAHVQKCLRPKKKMRRAA